MLTQLPSILPPAPVYLRHLLRPSPLKNQLQPTLRSANLLMPPPPPPSSRPQISAPTTIPNQKLTPKIKTQPAQKTQIILKLKLPVPPISKILLILDPNKVQFLQNLLEFELLAPFHRSI